MPYLNVMYLFSVKIWSCFAVFADLADLAALIFSFKSAKSLVLRYIPVKLTCLCFQRRAKVISWLKRESSETSETSETSKTSCRRADVSIYVTIHS